MSRANKTAPVPGAAATATAPATATATATNANAAIVDMKKVAKKDQREASIAIKRADAEKARAKTELNDALRLGTCAADHTFHHVSENRSLSSIHVYSRTNHSRPRHPSPEQVARAEKARAAELKLAAQKSEAQSRRLINQKKLQDTGGTVGIGVLLVSAIGTVWRSSGVPILIAGWIRNNYEDASATKTVYAVQARPCIYYTRPRTTSFARCSPFLEDFTSRRFSPPIPLCVSFNPDAPRRFATPTDAPPNSTPTSLRAGKHPRIHQWNDPIASPSAPDGIPTTVTIKAQKADAYNLKTAVAAASGLGSTGAEGIGHLAHVDPNLRFLRPLGAFT